MEETMSVDLAAINNKLETKEVKAVWLTPVVQKIAIKQTMASTSGNDDFGGGLSNF
jgi:hypothetical protein